MNAYPMHRVMLIQSCIANVNYPLNPSLELSFNHAYVI